MSDVFHDMHDVIDGSSADFFPPAASAVAFYNALSPASGVEVQSLSSVG